MGLRLGVSRELQSTNGLVPGDLDWGSITNHNPFHTLTQSDPKIHSPGTHMLRDDGGDILKSVFYT